MKQKKNSNLKRAAGPQKRPAAPAQADQTPRCLLYTSDFPVCVCGRKPRARLPFKVKGPSAKELEENPRSRSAKLRAVEKVGE